MVEIAFHYNIAQRRQSPFFNMKSIVERCSMCMQIARYSSKYGGKETYFCSPECHDRYNMRKAKVKNLILIRLDESSEDSDDEGEVIMVNKKSEPIDHSREERLFRMCRDGDHQRLHRILEKDFDLDISDKNGRSLLSVASFYGDSVLLKMLMYCGADVNFVGPDGMTALMAATESDDAKKVQLLLAAGAKPNTQDKDGRVALHLAAANSDAQCAKLLLEADPTAANSKDKFNITPLHLAAGKENLDLIRLLLNWGASTEEDNMGRLPLHWAVVEGSVPCVDELLMGSQTNDLDRADKMGQTAIHYAVHLNFADVVKMLVDKDCCLSIKNSKGLTPLLLASCCGDRSTCELLISANDKVLHDTDKLGWGALHYAASRNDEDLVNFFIDTGLDIDLRDVRGHSPIFIAATNGAVKVVKILIKKGALSLTVIDKIGRTPLHYSAEGGNIRVVSLLVAVISMMKIAKKLIEIQAWLDRKDDNGDNALYLAAVQGHRDVCQLLLDYNATIGERELDLLKRLEIAIPKAQVKSDSDFEGLVNLKDNPYKPATIFEPRRTTKAADHYMYVYSAPVVQKGPPKKGPKKPAWDDSTTIMSTPVKPATLSLQSEPGTTGTGRPWGMKVLPTSRYSSYQSTSSSDKSTRPSVPQTSRYFPQQQQQRAPDKKAPASRSFDPVSPRPRSTRSTPRPASTETTTTPAGSSVSSGYASASSSQKFVSVTLPRATNIDDSYQGDSPSNTPSPSWQRRGISPQASKRTAPDASRRHTGTPGIVSMTSTNLTEINEENESETSSRV